MVSVPNKTVIPRLFLTVFLFISSRLESVPLLSTLETDKNDLAGDARVLSITLHC